MDKKQRNNGRLKGMTKRQPKKQNRKKRRILMTGPSGEQRKTSKLQDNSFFGPLYKKHMHKNKTPKTQKKSLATLNGHRKKTIFQKQIVATKMHVLFSF